VKSRSRVDRDERFNTPSLRFVGGRAPYYHDGRFATLKDLLHGADGSMGHTAQLSPPDMEALEAFLMTL
jgi:cytochrome c peroxidase